MWTYAQRSGALYAPSGELVARGYAGHGAGLNMPSLQHVKNVGPLPCGLYTIGEPYKSSSHGPFVLRLTPSATNEMFGRAGFLIHGDSIHAPGSASNGCIILPRVTRERIAASSDTQLHVIADPQTIGELNA